MGKIVTFVSVPWVRSGIFIKSTCVRYSGDAQHATKTVILRQMYHECHWIFLSFFCSRAISPACSVDLGKSPTWWKSTWRSQTRTSTLKVSRRWRKFKLWLFTLLMMNDLFLCVFICSSASCIWVPLPGWCFDQAQQGCQYSRGCLYATAGQCDENSFLPVNTMLRFAVSHMGCYYLQDGLIQQCGETIKENISTKTVCGYYACASIYGLDSVMKKSEWTRTN